MIRRSQHWTETDIAPRRKRRTISNWVNYQNSSGIWLPSTGGDVEVTGGAPSDWEGGTFEFSHEKIGQALQFWAGDTSDVNNKAQIYFRKSDQPECWARIKAMGIDTNGIEPEVTSNDRGIRWVDLWTNSNLKWTIKRGAVSKNIRLKSAGHPANFRFRLVLPATLDHEIVGSRLRIFKKSDGSTVFRSKFAGAIDANGDHISTTLVDAPAAGNGDPTFRIIPDADELASATYPVDVDPTVTIEGTTDIEDGMLYEFNPDRNHGAVLLLTAERIPGSGTSRAIVVRVNNSGLPEGTYSEVRWVVYHNAASTAATEFARILPGNTYVEGNSNNAVEAGASCWSWSVHDTEAWLGGAGCQIAGTDFSNTDMLNVGSVGGSGGSTETVTFDSNGLADFQGWKDGDFENNGFIIWRKQPTSRYRITSVEDGTNPHYFEIDYTEGAPFGFFFGPA